MSRYAWIHAPVWKEGKQLARTLCGQEGIRLFMTNIEEKVTCPKCLEIMNEK